MISLIYFCFAAGYVKSFFRFLCPSTHWLILCIHAGCVVFSIYTYDILGI